MASKILRWLHSCVNFCIIYTGIEYLLRKLATSIGNSGAVKASAAETAAIQRVWRAFHVLKIFGGIRRKRSPMDNFADFADFA